MVTFLRACTPSKDHLERFYSVSFQLNRSIILPFSELMEKEPRHRFVQNCLHSTFAVEQLPIHFLRVSSTAKRNVEKSSVTVSVSDVFLINNLPYSLRWNKVDDIVSHFLEVFVEI